VANYGLGGHYATHHDSSGFYEWEDRAAENDQHFFNKFGPSMLRHNLNVGDRVATVMGYLR